MMVNSVMMCCWVLSLFQQSFGLVHSNIHLDDSQTSMRRTEPSFFSDIAGETQRSRSDPVLFPDESVEEQLMMDPGSYDEDFSQDDALQHQSRAMRSQSPRRCIPHQQSCLGHQLPCCNPCDICHCRFFNAFCSCRRLGQSCTNRRA